MAKGPKSRIDKLLVEQELVESREQAQKMVMAGLVYADGLRCNLHLFAELPGNDPHTNKLTCASCALAFLLVFIIEIQ